MSRTSDQGTSQERTYQGIYRIILKHEAKLTVTKTEGGKREEE